MSKLNLKPIGKIAIGVGKIVGYGLLMGLPLVRVTHTTTTSFIGTASYADAVYAIMESDMWSTDKRRAVSRLERDEDSDYYAAVVSIANSDCWSTDKLRMISDLND